MLYTVDELVDDRNRSLYESVASKVEIEFHEQGRKKQEEGWGSQYFEDRSVGAILCAPTRYPHACFAHELLHLKYELDGYQRPKHFTVGAPQEEPADCQAWAGGFLVYGYNQLMHQKMLPDFLSLGFPANQFLREDRGRLDRIASHIKKLQRAKSKRCLDPEYFVRVLLQLQNPSDNQKLSSKLIDALSRISTSLFGKTQMFVKQWSEDDSPDVALYLAKLFKLCGHPNVAVGNTSEEMIWAKDCE